MDPIRFIFAGSLQSRKGLPLLLEAWRRLGQSPALELWIAGSGSVPEAERASLPPNVRWLGRLPQLQLVQALQQCHVFVFPSLFEGLAQVQIEAAACGLPVVGTTHSGSEAFIEEGETGFTLPAGNLDALTETLVRLASQPDRIRQMRTRLLEHRSRWSWDAYGDRWATIINELTVAPPTP
jgi:glycosyltransferase involved in cell wall biosynthesis